MSEKYTLVGEGSFNLENAIVVNGNYYDIGRRVIKWGEKGGLNGYDTSRVVLWKEDRKTGKKRKTAINGKRYGKRRGGVDAINKIVQHHTGGFTAKQTFDTLHNQRKLSVPFIPDDWGMIYQTLDTVERAWHGGKMNSTSVGLENVLYPDAEHNPSAYSKKKRDKFNLNTHTTGKQYIQGNERGVFLMPKVQVDAIVDLTAGIWAAVCNEKGPIYLQNPDAPNFMSNAKGGVLMDFSPYAKDHRGQLLHANFSEMKWDMVGILDMQKFEQRTIKKFYEFLKRLK